MKHFIIRLLAFLQLGYISCYKPNAQSPDNSGPFTLEIKVDHPNNKDTITLYNLYWNDLYECTLNIDNVLPTLPPGSTFDVYLRWQNYDYSWGAWVQLFCDDAAEFSYEIVGDRLRIMLGKYRYDCSSDVRREYNVRIIAH